MASVKKISERKYKITVSNGYRAGGKKIARAKTITVPTDVPSRGIAQYVAHAAEELERAVKYGYTEDGEMTFSEYAERWRRSHSPIECTTFRKIRPIKNNN